MEVAVEVLVLRECTVRVRVTVELSAGGEGAAAFERINASMRARATKAMTTNTSASRTEIFPLRWVLPMRTTIWDNNNSRTMSLNRLWSIVLVSASSDRK